MPVPMVCVRASSEAPELSELLCSWARDAGSRRLCEGHQLITGSSDVGSALARDLQRCLLPPPHGVLPTFPLGLKPWQGAGRASFTGSVGLVIPIFPEHLSSVSQKDGASGMYFHLITFKGKNQRRPLELPGS